MIRSRLLVPRRDVISLVGGYYRQLSMSKGPEMQHARFRTLAVTCQVSSITSSGASVTMSTPSRRLHVLVSLQMLNSVISLSFLIYTPLYSQQCDAKPSNLSA
jgi:hypothetical protein